MVQLENLVDEQPELAQSNEGRVTWQGDALHQVLGEEKPGQVHGLGLLPVPKQVYDRTTRHFKDIKVARIDGSLSDIEAHMLEEIRQLKEHSRKQDQVIEELLNKQTRLENGEPTMVDCGATNHEKQVLHPRRKRVQCNITNHEDLLSDQIDEMDKERYEAQQIRHEDANYKELSHQDAESSSPPCSPNGSRQVEFGMHRRNSRGGRIVNEGKMCKRQYEVFQEATSLTQ
uniref:Uncharacterized protein n=1 Tax=Arundo donax TaxID=35708 RepID=A0A0A9D7J2_ARUDO